jgi:hypothetical protein
MTSSIGNLSLRFAAIVVLFAPAVAAQTPGTSQTVCRDVWVPGRVGALGASERAHTERVCDSVYYPPPPPPAPEPPVRHTTGWESNVQFDPAAEARKAQLRATEQRAPASSSLCPPPYRMTASDGCQR